MAGPQGAGHLGGWQLGDPAGDRHFAQLPTLITESGAQLHQPVLAYETWGTFTGSNAILVEHALTGDSHASGPAGPGHPTPGWWQGLIGPGQALDTDRFFVVCPNVLGGCQGSTGPSSAAEDGIAYGSRFPVLTTRDQVTAEAALTGRLGIEQWTLVIGGSMGGMRALEWAVSFPDRVQRLAVVASCAAATAEQIGLSSLQLHAITADPRWRGGDYFAAGQAPAQGLGLARRIAHLSYRSEQELQQRFGRRAQGNGEVDDPITGTGRFAIESYLDHHADKLVRRFDAASYVTLTRAMNSHDAGRDRGGVGSALGRVTAQTLVVSIDSDRLYLPWQQREIADGIAGAHLAEIKSPYGHDGFLIESDQLAASISPLL